MSLNKFVCNFCEKIILFLIKNYWSKNLKGAFMFTLI
jgi:hypothetical protein